MYSSNDSNNDRKVSYPKRENRRLPAHLADPNYINLLEDEQEKKKVVVQQDSDKNDENDDDDYSLKMDLEEDDALDDEDYTEDDPDKLWCICKQPHNNRFMICCDACEDWFHGNCVGVTRTQGKEIELKNLVWKCPSCKKKAKERASHTTKRASSGGASGSKISAALHESSNKAKYTKNQSSEGYQQKNLDHHKRGENKDGNSSSSNKLNVCTTKYVSNVSHEIINLLILYFIFREAIRNLIPQQMPKNQPNPSLIFMWFQLHLQNQPKLFHPLQKIKIGR
jgi:hypothetical protein